jgi:hypothetical protein
MNRMRHLNSVLALDELCCDAKTFLFPRPHSHATPVASRKTISMGHGEATYQ